MASSASFLYKKNVTWANVPSYLKLSSIWTEYFEGSALYIFSAKNLEDFNRWPTSGQLASAKYDLIART